MKTILIILLLLMPFQAQAFDEWTKKDTAYQITYSIFHVLDWRQTQNIAKSEEHCIYESNPIIGQCASSSDVNAYFIATLALHTSIAYMLPSQYRRLWQITWIGLEAGTVALNYSAGIRLDF